MLKPGRVIAFLAHFFGRLILSARAKAEKGRDSGAVVARSPHGGAAEAPGGADETVIEMIELFFFAYRDFVKDADRLLENYNFGRAHHRVLHFVNRRPGLTIAALLDILKITKQSLNRVLKPLLEGGFIEARAGALDRRQRLLFPTQRGRALANDLTRLQSARFVRVLDGLAPEARRAATDFLLAMIDEDDRTAVRAHLERAGAKPAKVRALLAGAEP
ncbi:MarR family transcriptional regulator [Methylocystis heyeri]|uniref:MarR family transcriptional regulator n=2 Tax=Methylocystis heyeri TaxID=391905 RepID=A0A6B8KEQ9_9HYPH|nr:MarR family transcriptional regulator [Methylocystis heyeri]QGM44933.1 MarR family transcriptional regulator [Methylocystis heyeri]